MFRLTCLFFLLQASITFRLICYQLITLSFQSIFHIYLERYIENASFFLSFSSRHHVSVEYNVTGRIRIRIGVFCAGKYMYTVHSSVFYLQEIASTLHWITVLAVCSTS